MKERTRLEGAIATIKRLRAAIDDNVGLIEMAEAEKDEAMIADAERALAEARAEAAKARLETLLSGEADANNAYVEINAGAGGTEAQDWAEMLARMYTRWAERRGFKVSWLEESAGEEAGIKSCAFKVEGPNAYGWLKTESGVHRLVRISPVRRQRAAPDQLRLGLGLSRGRRRHRDRAHRQGPARRHLPRLGRGRPARQQDRLGGAHHPSSRPASPSPCSRSARSTRTAPRPSQMLKARLYELELQKREAERLEAEASKTDIGWGHQIRSYVLQPYQMVKDLRTGVETLRPAEGAGRRPRRVHGGVAGGASRRGQGQGSGVVRLASARLEKFATGRPLRRIRSGYCGRPGG